MFVNILEMLYYYYLIYRDFKILALGDIGYVALEENGILHPLKKFKAKNQSSEINS